MGTEITLNVGRLVGGVIAITTGRNPAMTRLWWTTPRSGGEMQSRDGGDYSDVAITGELTQAKIDNIDGHGRTSVVAVEIGNTVTSIGNRAFQGCSGLTSMTIGSGVTNIGIAAFYGCRGLTSVTIPDGVTSIGDYAFENCSGLTSVTIPDSVTSIGDWAFLGCITLQEMYFPGMSMDYVAQNSIQWGIGINSATGKTFMVTAYCMDGIVVLNAKSGSSSGGSEGDQGYTYVDYFNGRWEKYDISGQFYEYTIYDIKDAQRIEFGNQISDIGYNVCANSPYLEYVKIPSSVSNIGEYAFSGCRNLSEIGIEGQPMIGSYAFYDSPIQTAWMASFMMWNVAEYASYWGLGFGNSGTHTVVVYCYDGILVLNGDSGSSGSGS